MRIAVFMTDALARESLLAPLAAQGYSLVHFATQATLLRGLRRGGLDLAIVDPCDDPLLEDRLLTWVRCRQVDECPVVMMLPMAESHRVAHALLAGFDDVMARSVQPEELLARLVVASRRHARRVEVDELKVGGFELERRFCRVSDRGVPVELTAREFALAWLLFSQAGACVSRETISLAIWGTDSVLTSRTVEEHVHRLRRKLGLGEARGVSIRAHYGHGYQVVVEDEARNSACGAPVADGHHGRHSGPTRALSGRRQERDAAPAGAAPIRARSAASCAIKAG